MESYDSSPNYVRGTPSFDAKKENSPQGGSERDDIISLNSSAGGSAIENNRIKYRTNSKKIQKNFGSVKSFRRRAKSRIIQSPVTLSDDSLVESSGSSPHYLKATSCSEGKKTYSQSLQPKLASPSHRSLQTLSKTSSFRNVRILIKKTSFRPRRLSYAKVSEDVSVDRATFSSTLKDAKFPEVVELHDAGIESEKNPGLKVCRYHHCSLHGHCGGGHDPAPPPKHFLYKRRRSLKKQRSSMPQTVSKTKHSSDKNKNIKKSQMVPAVEGLVQEGLSVKNGMGPHGETNAEPEAWQFGDRRDSIRDLDLTETVFGEMSFPERSYEENLNLLRKYSSREQGYCLRCSCHKTEEGALASGRADVDLSELKVDSSSVENCSNNEIRKNGSADVLETSTSACFENPEENVSTNVDESGILTSEEAFKKECPENSGNSGASSTSHSLTSTSSNSEDEGELTTESIPAGDLEGNKVMEGKDSEASSRIPLQFSKKRHVSMWHLIHQHMSSNLVAKPESEPLQVAEDENLVDGAKSTLARESSSSGRDLLDSETGTGNDDAENQEIEVRKLFAIKLVRAAIEKILLPEVQSDDQSVTSENCPQPEVVEKIQSEACTQENYAESDANKGESNVSSKEEILITDKASGPEIKETEEKVVRKPEKKAPKHWSNLKKWILLQRFIRELEKVKKFKPRKPQLLPLNPDPGAEKVNLRPQTADERRNAEEWMLDYALRQAVNQLAPTQKKKVALLVKAFETVVPQREEPQVQFRIPRLKDNSTDIGSNKEEAPVNEKVVLARDDGVSIWESENQENGTESGSKEEIARESSACSDSVLIPEDRDVENRGPSLMTQSLIPDGNGKSVATEDTLGRASPPDETGEARPMVQDLQEDDAKNSGQGAKMDRKNHIKMWHMIYQHVVSGIADKVGSQLLDGSEDDEAEDNETLAINNADYSGDFLRSSEKIHALNGFTKSDALKLIKEAVDEILVAENQDDLSDTQSVMSESISDHDISERNDKSEVPKAKNWSKLKKLILLRRSIRALEKARELKRQPCTLLPQMSDPGPEKVGLRSQMMDERKKAEQWMLDYAVQHIVTKLTPSRKRRVSMLVEAFEAVVPLPEM